MIWWTTSDIADRMGVDPRTVQRWAVSGLLPGARRLPGGEWRFPRKEVLEWIARGKEEDEDAS